MKVRRGWYLAAFAAVLIVSAAAYYALAQEGALLTEQDGPAGFAVTAAASSAVSAEARVGTAQQAEVATVAGEEETQATLAAATLAQTAGEEAEIVALATPSRWLEERTWADGVTTVVECTTVGATRSCRVSVFGPGGEFILGREIPASGEAFGCPGQCIDATGAVLDSSSVARAQGAIAAGDRDVGVVSAGTPMTAEVEVEISPGEETVEAVQERGE